MTNHAPKRIISPCNEQTIAKTAWTITGRRESAEGDREGRTMTFTEAFEVFEQFDLPHTLERKLALMVAGRIEDSEGDKTFAEIIDQSVNDLVGATHLYGY